MIFSWDKNNFFLSLNGDKRKSFILALISERPVFSIKALSKTPASGQERFLTGTIRF